MQCFWHYNVFHDQNTRKNECFQQIITLENAQKYSFLPFGARYWSTGVIKNTKKSFEVSGADGTLFRGVGGGGMEKLSRSNLPKNEQLVAELAIWPLSPIVVRYWAENMQKCSF